MCIVYFRLEKRDLIIERSGVCIVYWFEQYNMFDLRLDNNHQYILDSISILGTIVLNPGTEHVVPIFLGPFPGLLAVLSEQDREIF